MIRAATLSLITFISLPAFALGENTLRYEQAISGLEFETGPLENSGEIEHPVCTDDQPKYGIEVLKSYISRGKDVTNFCTSLITDMSHLFEGNADFYQDISNWNVSNVVNMQSIIARRM
jgi:surface protein